VRQRFCIPGFSAVLLGLSLLLSPASLWASDQQFKVDSTTGLTSTVKFTSDAPLELINGQTSTVTGKIRIDNTFKFDAHHPFLITMDVDLRTIDTGIPLRNEHMRDQYLETTQYPKATFRVTHLTTKAMPPFKAGQVINLTATGPFTVHGKSVVKTIPLKITYLPLSNKKATHTDRVQIRIQGTFPVNLDEHGIKRPEMVFQKLAETVYVAIDLLGESMSEKTAIKSTDKPIKK
jgi:polyisoprenoid-binding protein YceI